MKGHLHITASAGPGGRTFLSSQSFRAPLHLSKPHNDGRALVVNLVNPTAGLFDGDEVQMHAVVESGAHAVLTTPSAGRVYRSRSGAPAVVTQELTVHSGGFAEYFPELFIPQAGSRYRQTTVLRVAPGGRLLFCEWLAPGRVAGGEAFDYEELLWDTDVWSGDRLVVRERYRLTPHDDSLASLRTVSPTAHYVGFFVLGWPAWPEGELDAVSSDTVYLGHGPLPGSAKDFVIKAICGDSLSARATQRSVRSILYRALGETEPALRRM